jgi:hypothetical protein
MTDGGNAAVLIKKRMLNRIAFLTQEQFACKNKKADWSRPLDRLR